MENVNAIRFEDEIEFNYVDSMGNTTHRTVVVTEITKTKSNICMIGGEDSLRGAHRNFRVDRMTNLNNHTRKPHLEDVFYSYYKDHPYPKIEGAFIESYWGSSKKFYSTDRGSLMPLYVEYSDVNDADCFWYYYTDDESNLHLYDIEDGQPVIINRKFIKACWECDFGKNYSKFV